MKHNWSMTSLSGHTHICLTPEGKDAVGKSAKPGGVPHTCEVPSFIQQTSVLVVTKTPGGSRNYQSFGR